MALLLLTGCSTLQPQDSITGPSYRPANIVRTGPKLPPNLQRVAVLPLAAPVNHHDFEHGILTLEPILQAELLKVARFECVWITPKQAVDWTGQAQWRAADALPASFFAKLREGSGCDGVLFCELSEYRPYTPMSVGWRFRLVEGTLLETVWATDEVFDAGNDAVVNGARRYQQANQVLTQALQDSRAVLISPRRFGQYSLATLLATLPEPAASRQR